RPGRQTAICALLLMWSASLAADTYPRQPGVDAIHYVFRLSLGDASDEIVGETTVTVKVVTDGLREVVFDLTSAASNKGMTVTSVTLAPSGPLLYAHAGDRLRVTLPAPAHAEAELSFTINYTGIPGGGLRLINNIHGERTMFSENWPNNGRTWLPTGGNTSEK